MRQSTVGVNGETILNILWHKHLCCGLPLGASGRSTLLASQSSGQQCHLCEDDRHVWPAGGWEVVVVWAEWQRPACPGQLEDRGQAWRGDWSCRRWYKVSQEWALGPGDILYGGPQNPWAIEVSICKKLKFSHRAGIPQHWLGFQPPVDVSHVGYI